jgi:hypothetical protein
MGVVESLTRRSSFSRNLFKTNIRQITYDEITDAVGKAPIAGDPLAVSLYKDLLTAVVFVLVGNPARFQGVEGLAFLNATGSHAWPFLPSLHD